MTTIEGAAQGADRRAQIERTLAHYPDLAPDQIDELIAWFDKEATALDVAMVASNPAIAEPYRRFRADHIDPMTSKDILRGILFATLICMVVIVIIWRAL